MVDNAAVGGSMMDKTRHSQTRITSDVKKVLQYHNDPRFKSTTVLKLNDAVNGAVSKLFEVTRGKRTIRQDRPLHIGVAVYDLAKMRMLQFYYDFVDKFLSRDDYQMMEMDTDSNYMALPANPWRSWSGPSFEKCSNKRNTNGCPTHLVVKRIAHRVSSRWSSPAIAWCASHRSLTLQTVATTRQQRSVAHARFW